MATAPHRGPTASGESGRIHGADSVRAFACLWVFVTHLGIPTALDERIPRAVKTFVQAGASGVPMFFVLSGFLLSMPYLKAHKRGREMPSLKVYAVRRLGRIVPGYYACVLILVLIFGLYHHKWDLLVLGTMLSFTNSFISAAYKPVWDDSLWSIPIEMQFYLMLPFFAWGAFRIRSARGVRLYCVLVIAALAVLQWEYLKVAPHIERAVNDPAWYSAGMWSTTRNAAALFVHFLIGFLAADAYLSLLPDRKPVVAGSPKNNSSFNRYDLAVLLVLGLLAAVVFHVITPPQLRCMNFNFPTFPLLIGALLVSLALSGVLGRWIDNPVMRATGTLSFGIYLWHRPILEWLERVWPKGWDQSFQSFVLFGATALALVYLVAAASYFLVERPVLNWSSRYGRQAPEAMVMPPNQTRGQ